jgi:hypothetical protein
MEKVSVIYHKNNKEKTYWDNKGRMPRTTKDCLQDSGLPIPNMTLMTLVWARNTFMA